MVGTKEFTVKWEDGERIVRLGVYCGRCGRGLCCQSTVTDANPPHWDRSVTVPPCKDCERDFREEVIKSLASEQKEIK